MSASCCGPKPDPNNSPQWRRALWIALAVNAGMFVIEMVAGAAADSKALQADALDFFGDATNYAISLAVSGMVLAWRSRAAMFKGITLLLMGGYVLITAVMGALGNGVPEPKLMGAIGVAALVANVAVALMLYRFKGSDANMQSVWICSRNDAVGNVAVVVAAAGVFGTGTVWPDLLVASILATLGVWGGLQIITQASRELIGGAQDA